ncbi:MAG: undecaprenyl diphosphate synthase family protein [Clostridia bacterium]|nr:undecaprenyl diphosphate synthase family protein [Clostridia bacterium]
MRIPKHIAIIPDGNRRWASQNGLEKQEGYQHGLDPGLSLLRSAIKYGIEEITYYGFTVDNCKRPLKQQEAFKKACVDAVEMIIKEGDVSLLVIGDSSSECFPQELIQYIKRKNIGTPKIKVNFLVNYGWDWDISNIYESNKKGDIIKDIHSYDISRIDLVIRWGNMRRLSGLLPIQTVYSDFYVLENLWPDYNEKDLTKAINWYQVQDVTLGG